MPGFTSPHNGMDIDNPFDALERQMNDVHIIILDLLDLLSVSLLYGSGKKSPVQEHEMSFRSEPGTNEILKFSWNLRPISTIS